MKNQESNPRKSVSENLAKVFLIHSVPELAEILINAIPDLTYERYLKDYKAIWNIALPAASFAILRKYAGSELERTFTVQMAYGIRRAINKRAERGKRPITSSEIANNHERPIKTGAKKWLKICECIDFLNKTDFEAFTKRLNSLPTEQRNGALNSLIPDDESMKEMISLLQDHGRPLTLTNRDSKELYSNPPDKILKIYYLKLLLNFSDPQFTSWASTCFDEKRKQRIKKMTDEKLAKILKK